MKVFKRVFVKLIILLVVIALGGGSAASYQAYRQSTAGYAIDHYLSLLIDNSVDKAFVCLDQSEEQPMSQTEYGEALEAKKYSLYASYTVTEKEKSRDNDGNEYVDYEVEFLDAAGEKQMEEEFTVKKQSQQVLGMFDRWKVLSSHCMVKNFLLTVPAGSEVYLNAEKADTSWITSDGGKASYDCYQIPSLLPGKISLTVRHPALESVNATLDATDGSADYTDKMPLKESAKDECVEMGVNLLKEVYSSAVKNETDKLKLLKECEDTGKRLIQSQSREFDQEDRVFKNVAVSSFAATFGDLELTDEENGAITTEMTFSYHYVVRRDVTVDTEELQEDGTPVQQTETREEVGDSTAKMTMAYYDNAWHVTALEMDVIPK